MPFTNFPNGVTSLGIPLVGSQIPTTSSACHYWFVNSATGNSGNPGTMDSPFNSLANACSSTVNGALTANDIVIIMPGHTETVSSAGAITISTAGIQVVGLGTGSKRPTFTFDSAVSASLLISGAGVSIKNIVGVAGIDSLTNPINITGDNVSVDIEWVDSTYEAVRALLATSVDNLKVRLRHRGLVGGSLCVNSIRLTGATGATLTDTEVDIDFYGKASTSVVEFTGDAASVLGVRIGGSLYNSGTTDGTKSIVDTATSSTWWASIWDGAAGAPFSGGSGSALAKDDLSAVTDALYGANGVVTWPDPVAPADAVSLAEGMRWISSRQGIQAGINPLGSVLYVAASGGNDSATGGGKDPTEPLATVAQAITNASAGDTIVLGPGTHSVDVSSAALTPKANLTFVGAIPSEGGRPSAVITHDADDGADLVTVDVSGVVFRDITFLMVAGGTTAIRLFDVAQTTAVTGLSFLDCWFDLNSVDAAGVTAINMDDATNAVTGLHIKNCRFTGGDATTNQAVYIDIGVGGMVKALLEDNTFELESADGDAKAMLFADPGASGKSYANVIRHNYFVGPKDGGSDAIPIEFNAGMTEDEIVGIIAENYFGECAATPVTASKVDGSIVSTSDMLQGGNGIPTWPDPAAPADAVSVAEGVRWISSRQGVQHGINPLGSVYYVAASGGSDSATGGGLDPTEPLASVAQAITNASAGDTIVLGPGTHSVDVSASALVPKANLNFVGANPSEGGRPTTIITHDADDGADLVTIDVSGVIFRDITFLMVAGGTTAIRLVDVSQTTAVTGLSFIDCWFDLNSVDAAGVTAINIDDATNATTGLHLKNCRFTGGDATTNQAVYVDIGVGGLVKALVEDSTFELESADGDAKALLFADPGASGASYANVIRHNYFVGPKDGGSDAVPIEFNAAMTEDEIVGIIAENYFAECAATPITASKVDGSIVSTSDMLQGGNGIPVWADPAAPADAVSLAEAIRWIASRQGVIGGFNPLGSVYYVAASGGDDAATGGGLDPTEPLNTIAQAITNASAGDTIVLGPGTHSVDVSAAALAPKANLKFRAAVPAHGGRPTTIITHDADDGADLVTVDVDGVSFEGIRFLNVAGGTTAIRLVDVAQTTAVNGLSFIDCEFDLNDVDAAGITALNIDDATNATTGLLIKGCRFRGATATTNQAIYIDVGVGGIPSALIEDNIFECGSDDADALAVNFADPGAGDKSYGWTFRNNDIVGPMDYGNDGVPIVFAGAMTEGEIIGMIRGNFFSCTSATPITQDEANQSLVNNYVGDAATGGTLVDPGT